MSTPAVLRGRVLAGAALVLASAVVALPAPSAAAARAVPTLARPCAVPGATRAYQHVVWIVLENVGYGVVGSPDAPYLNRLIAQCGLATNYHGTTHPSLPNYIALASGSAQGVSNDNDPASHPLAAPSIFSQLNGKWRSYVESMPTPCDKVSAGEYAAKHNPAAYFTNLGPTCALNDVPLPAHPSFVQPFTFVTPNLCHDMHDCSVAVGDAWMRAFVPKVLSSPQYRAGSLVLAITFDENTSDSSNRVPTIVLAPSVPRGLKVGAYLNHYSLLRTTEQLLRLAPLAGARSARTMVALFHL
ncbi:MAG TPA: alkaline phosphatase family protein [Acidimicrobiales bacterium]|nr:MAG: hypothetical protein B7Z69_04195 [Actinobacteria bacterium 21-73-9]HQU25764.1 alkaline phosphatase family protein [Acidimicrobiales bacterium]